MSATLRPGGAAVVVRGPGRAGRDPANEMRGARATRQSERRGFRALADDDRIRPARARGVVGLYTLNPVDP